MNANILVYDIGSTYTKLAAFAEEGEELYFLGSSRSLTTLQDVRKGASLAEAGLREQGVSLANEVRRFSSCSAAGGLRMVAMGYMPRVTAKAAKEVAMTAGARIMEVISFEDPPEYREEVLMEIRPDIILLAGGTDSGDQSSVLQNAEIICKVKTGATVILACNRAAQKAAAKMFAEAGIHYVRVANIMPTIHKLEVRPAREAIHEEFIRQITEASGLMEFRDTLANRTVVPTPGAVLQASELLASGTHEEEGVGSLLLVDIGGATTDVHSAIPELAEKSIEEIGLVVNNAKQFSYRTVEGNLGMRVSAAGILDTVGPKAILRRMDPQVPGLTAEDITDYCEMLEDNTGYLPEDPGEKNIDRAMASCAIETALRRHAGYYAEEADPVMGIAPGTPIGRDLRSVERVLCVGGILTHTEKELRRGIMHQCFRNPGMSLLPGQEPEYIFDDHYILYACGVLSRHMPDAVLRLMKRELLAEESFAERSKGENYGTEA